MRKAAREVLAPLDIDIADSKLGLPVRSLSGGQRQAVAIGRAIYWKAELLIMDEPTAALGVPEQRKVMELIQALRRPGRGRDLHLATTWSTSSPSPTASWCSAAASPPASGGRQRPTTTRSCG